MKSAHALAWAAGLLVTVALAQDPREQPVPAESEPPKESAAGTVDSSVAAQLPEFSTLDRNADTTISREEARAHAGLRSIFNECDADRNGVLNAWEFAEAVNRLEHGT